MSALYVEAPVPSPALEAPEAPPQGLQPGTRVDRYEIIRALGAGGTADVYEAEHVDLGRRVALKVLRCGAGDADETLERFHQEARTSSALRHPNIGDVFDVGYTTDGSPYLVMELLTGESLDAWITRKPLSIAAALEVCAELADALGFVHSKGILHRDVKPGNVVLHREHAGRTVAKLVDFGISKPVMHGPSERAITREGLVVGTPHYMAPEYLGGGPPTTGMDIYAAGVVLYECLAGRPPFDEQNMTALVAAILRDEAPPITQFRPNCPKPVIALVARAMHRDPSKRFASAAEFALELRRVGTALNLELGPAVLDEARAPSELTDELRARRGLAATERPVPTPEPQFEQRRHSGHLMWIAAAAAAALTLVTGTGIAVLGAGQPSALAQTPDHALKIVRPIRTKATGQMGLGHLFVEAALPSVERTGAAPQSTPALAAPPIAPVLPALPPLPRRATTHASSTRPTLDRPARIMNALPTVQAAAPVVHVEAPIASPDVGIALARRALLAYATGQFPRALALYREAVRQDPNAANAWRGLGVVATRMGQPMDARHAFSQYLALAPHAADAPQVRSALAEVGR